MTLKTFVGSSQYVLLGILLGATPPLIILNFISSNKSLSQMAEIDLPEPDSNNIKSVARNARSVDTHWSHSDNNGEIYSKIFGNSPQEDGYYHKKMKRLRDRGDEKPAATNSKRNRFQSLSSIKSLGFRKGIFVGVLSEESRVHVMSSAVSTTWGSDVSDVYFLYATLDGKPANQINKYRRTRKLPIHVSEAYSDSHAWEGIKRTCGFLQEEYSWYVIMKDTLYLEASKAKKLLNTLYHDDSVIFGQHVDGKCSAKDSGVIFTRKAFQELCHNVHKCKDNDEMDNFGKCVLEATSTPCMDLPKVGESSNGDDTIQISREGPLFIPNMKSPNDLYAVHLQQIDDEIQETRSRLNALQQNLDLGKGNPAQNHPNEFLHDLEGKMDKAELTETRPSHEFLNVEGQKIEDCCRDCTGNTEENSAYALAKNYADDIALFDEHDYDSFGYVQSVSAFQMVHEFYYTEPKSGRYSVKHVIVGQNYSTLKMKNRFVHKPQDLHVVTSIFKDSDVKYLKGFLDILQQACSNISPLNISCHVSVLYGIYANISELENIVDEFTWKIHADTIVNNISVEIVLAEEDIIDDNTLSVSNFGESIIAHISVNLIFDHEFLLRCQINSLPQNNVYFPVPFQLLVTEDEWITKKTFEASQGFWHSDYSETFCISLQHFKPFPAMSVDNIFDYVKIKSNMTVNRYPEPGVFFPNTYHS